MAMHGKHLEIISFGDVHDIEKKKGGTFPKQRLGIVIPVEFDVYVVGDDVEWLKRHKVTKGDKIAFQWRGYAPEVRLR